MKNFNRNYKAISPIFATLILIAIAVIAGIVVYMYTSGTISSMTGSATAAQEKVAVQGLQITDASVSVYAQTTNGVGATVNAIIVKDSSGVTVDTITVPVADGVLNKDGTLATITEDTTAGAIVPGNYYTVTLTTTKGGSFNSAATQATSST